METKVSFYERFWEQGSVSDLMGILSKMKDGKISKNKILEIRDLKTNGQDYGHLKKELPGFTPSGVFSGSRRASELGRYNKIVILDLDDLTNKQLKRARELAVAEEHTLSAFVSPSGCGLKILVRVDVDAQLHEIAFRRVRQYFESLLGVTIDKSGKDVSRLCFISYDPNLYVNTQCRVFQISGLVEDKFKEAEQLTSKSYLFEKGQRNNFVFTLGCYCNRLGLPENETLTYVLAKYNYNESEVVSSIKSAYSKDLDPIMGSFKEGDPIEIYLGSHYDLRFNKVRGVVELKSTGESKYKTLSDRKINSLIRELRAEQIKVTKNRLIEILESDFSPEFHPMREYLSKLTPWDGTIDYLSELASRVSTDDDEFFQIAFKKWFIAMIACSITPEITNQTAIIFSGPQGIGKSTFIGRLLPEELSDYQFSGMLDPKSKDSMIHLAECFIIDMDELSNLTRRSNNEMKELITKGRVRVRRPYGKMSEDLPRCASFTGSVNESRFLTDITGNRRFLCFNVSKIDYITPVNYEGLFSQALKLFQEGEKYHFDHEEIAYLNKRNESFRQKSLLEEIMMEYEPAEEISKAFLYLNAGQFLQRLHEHHGLKLDETNNIQLGKLLSQKGYKKTKRNGREVYAIGKRGTTNGIKRVA